MGRKWRPRNRVNVTVGDPTEMTVGAMTGDVRARTGVATSGVVAKVALIPGVAGAVTRAEGTAIADRVIPGATAAVGIRGSGVLRVTGLLVREPPTATSGKMRVRAVGDAEGIDP